MEQQSWLLLLFRFNSPRTKVCRQRRYARRCTRLLTPAILPGVNGRPILASAEFSNTGLVSYGVDNPDLLSRSADYIDRILKGAKPQDLPVQLPTKFALAINLKTAKSLGVTIPENLIATADEVVE